MSRTVVALTALFLSLSACTKSAPEAGDAAAGSPEAKATKEVNLAIWANYISPEMQEKFTKETGIVLKISNFSSNEELLAKIQAGASGIDVAVPSDYMVDVMTKEKLLNPLDDSKIPNKSGLDPSVLHQSYDPENKFSLPYSWGTAGIAVNRALYKGEIKGWKDVLTKKELAGKISLLDDVREVTAGALKANGYSVNTTNETELAKAKEMLKAARPRVKMFRSDTIDALVNKEVAIAHTYSVDALQAAQKDSKIEYIIPEEGGTRSIDNLVVLKTAKNVEAAHALINFLLSQEASTSFVKTVMGGPVVTATKAALSKELQANNGLFPSAAVMGKLESIHDVGDATRLYDRLWTEIKTE
ncbi:MAG TPA: spermidine/putrescine ABC transporter substrate-binding protein [Bdellovibrionales bacterium]|nr:spermidine/putrescine ABC transporter substrate-binding protein [Bdellovibrionales bacterium]